MLAIASTLPSALYFRQKLKVLQERFYRDTVRRDPNVHTTLDDQALFGSLIEDVYGSGYAFFNQLEVCMSIACHHAE